MFSIKFISFSFPKNLAINHFCFCPLNLPFHIIPIRFLEVHIHTFVLISLIILIFLILVSSIILFHGCKKIFTFINTTLGICHLSPGLSFLFQQKLDFYYLKELCLRHSHREFCYSYLRIKKFNSVI